jgi:hypothetical protein
MKTNMYHLIGGHMYFNNRVIKVRFDLLLDQSNLDLHESIFFDQYYDVLQLESRHDVVQMGSPLITGLYNRLAYLVENKRTLKPRTLLIMPYLHERKIHLNWRTSSDQFYTISKHEDNNFIICMCVNDNKIYVYSETGVLCEKYDYQRQAEDWGRPHEVSEDAKIMMFKKANQTEPQVTMVSIRVMGLEYMTTVRVKERLESYMAKLAGG